MTNESFTNIFDAAAKGSVDDVKYFVEQEADVNEKDNGGNTPLHYTAEYGTSVDVVKSLIECGADVDSQNNAGQTPFDLSLKNTNEDVGKYFFDRTMGQVGEAVTDRETLTRIKEAVMQSNDN